MNRAAFLEVVELYAAHALSPEEMRAADAFLREDADEECRAALRRAQRTWAAVGTSIEPVRPDERVWEAIEKDIRGAAGAPASRTGARLREGLAWAVAACAIVAVVFVEARREATLMRALHAEGSAALGWRHATELEEESAARQEKLALAEKTAQSDREACARALDSARGDALAKATALAILQSPGMRLLPLAPQAGSTARATALLDLKGHRAALVGAGLSAPSDKDYELWIIRGNEKIAAGLVKADASGSAVLALDRALLEAGKIDALAVTLEPAGGSPQPLGAIVLVAPVKG